MESGNQRIIINGQEYYAGAASTSINTGVSLFLFASNNTNSRRYAYAKIHSFALYDSATGEPLANYIPVLASRGSKPGMYDTVSKVFKTNAGYGEFAVPM